MTTFTTIVKLLGVLMQIGPMIAGLFAAWQKNRNKRLDAEAIKNAKKAKTPEERRESAKNLLDRTNS